MRIIIDADACPKSVLSVCMESGEKHKIPVWTVASFNHNIESDNHIIVDSSSQAADIKIMNMAKDGDIVVTQDWGLAAMLLSKKVYCISPGGKIFRNDTIDFLLEERQMKAEYRRAGGRTKGPSKRSREEDEQFRKSLERIICSKE